MKKEKEEFYEIKIKYNFPKLFGKLMSLCFGMTWLIIVFKLFHLNYFDKLSWWTILLPTFFYLMASIIYIVLLYCYIQWTLPPIAYTEKAQQYLNRRFYQWRKPTKTRTIAVKLLILAFSLSFTPTPTVTPSPVYTACPQSSYCLFTNLTDYTKYDGIS